MTQPLAGKHILIVEDEPVFRSLLDSWLSSLGAMTSLAEDGIDALRDKGAYGFNLVFLFLLGISNLQGDAALQIRQRMDGDDLVRGLADRADARFEIAAGMRGQQLFDALF